MSVCRSLPIVLLLLFGCSDTDRLRIFASMGNAEAQSALGARYCDGKGVPKDAAEAVEWYRKAAEQGDTDAQSSLGVAYHNGDGVPKDLVQAHMWFNLAAASGVKGAAETRRKAESQMTKEQVAEAEKLARAWYEAHRGEKK